MKIKAITVGLLKTNCYVVSDEPDANGVRHAAIIDPGGSAEKIMRYIERENLVVSYILLTHGHFDHILAAPELRRRTGAPIVISSDDADCLMSPLRSLSNQLRATQECVEPDIVAADGAVFLAGNMVFRYMHTPGHTAGSSVIICERNIFSGDTLFCGDCGRTDLPGGNYRTILRSLAAIASLSGDFDVYPGHDVSTTLSHERESNLNLMEAMNDIDRSEFEQGDFDDAEHIFEDYFE